MNPFQNILLRNTFVRAEAAVNAARVAYREIGEADPLSPDGVAKYGAFVRLGTVVALLNSVRSMAAFIDSQPEGRARDHVLFDVERSFWRVERLAQMEVEAPIYSHRTSPAKGARYEANSL